MKIPERRHWKLSNRGFFIDFQNRKAYDLDTGQELGPGDCVVFSWEADEHSDGLLPIFGSVNPTEVERQEKEQRSRDLELELSNSLSEQKDIEAQIANGGLRPPYHRQRDGSLVLGDPWATRLKDGATLDEIAAEIREGLKPHLEEVRARVKRLKSELAALGGNGGGV